VRNLIANIYCTRDRNTQVCSLHIAARAGKNNYAQLKACMQCEYCVTEFTAPGRSLADRGLPRLTPGMDLANFEGDRFENL
jgi:hypothetical protein